MDIDKLTGVEREDMLAEIANQYYYLGKNQSEIAKEFGTNRFRIAKLLQDARDEHIVEIRIRSSRATATTIEEELRERFSLQKALVVDTQYLPYIEALSQIGDVGAKYLDQIIQDESVLGVTWGKTIYSVTSQLQPSQKRKASVLQLAGGFRVPNPTIDSRSLVPAVASVYNGSYYYMDAPLYVKDPVLKDALFAEPSISGLLTVAQKLDIVLTGIGGISSLPLSNPAFAPYLTPADKAAEKDCFGSLYGYVLNANGDIADIPLNEKVVSVPVEQIRSAAHRLLVVYGRHKAQITALALKKKWINEILTDADTARRILELV